MCTTTPLKIFTVFPAIVFVPAPSRVTFATKFTVPLLPGRIKLQCCFRGKRTVADGEHAVVTQSGDFNHVGVSIDRVAQIWAPDIDLPAISRVPDVDRSAISHQSTVHVRGAARAGSKNGYLPARPGRSRIEQAQQLSGVRNVDRYSARLITCERQAAAGLPQTPRSPLLRGRNFDSGRNAHGAISGIKRYISAMTARRR